MRHLERTLWTIGHRLTEEVLPLLLGLGGTSLRPGPTPMRLGPLEPVFGAFGGI